MDKSVIHKLTVTAFAAALALAFAACSSDDDGGAADSRLLRFSASVQQDLTRTATPGAYVGPNFGLIGFAFDSWQQTLKPDYIYNDEVSKCGDYWTPLTPRYWPEGSSYARFYAYAPYGADNVVLSSRTTQGPPTLTYTIAPELIDQKDLVLAASDDADCASHPEVSLVFNHLLTGVKFAEGRIRSGLVTSITIDGVRNQGTYKTSQAQWENQSGKATYQQPVSYTTGTEGADIMTDKAFLMMPQNVPAGATVIVTIQGTDDQTNEERTYTLTANIGGQVWNAGDWLSYRINADAIVIYHIKGDPIIIPWDNVTEEIMYFFVEGSPWINAWDQGYTNDEAVDYNTVTAHPFIHGWGGSEDDNNIDYRLIGGAASIKAWAEAQATGIDYNNIIARYLIQGWNDASDGKGPAVDYNTIATGNHVNAWDGTNGNHSIDYNTVTGHPAINGWHDADDEEINM